MGSFNQYRRKQIAELRPVTDADIKAFEQDKHPHSMRDTEFRVSISDADIENGSPKIGDMIARNPKTIWISGWLLNSILKIISKKYERNSKGTVRRTGTGIAV